MEWIIDCDLFQNVSEGSFGWNPMTLFPVFEIHCIFLKLKVVYWEDFLKEVNVEPQLEGGRHFPRVEWPHVILLSGRTELTLLCTSTA